jgi:hypothetical protein
MAGRFLIDVTDARFSIPENAEVMEFIRRVNPFAHSDVGQVLFDLAREIGAGAYCPAPKVCAYVVLHSTTNRIFAIAYDQRSVAFRLPDGSQAEALTEGGEAVPKVGTDWIRFDPWAGARAGGINPHLRSWAERSFADCAAA